MCGMKMLTQKYYLSMRHFSDTQDVLGACQQGPTFDESGKPYTSHKSGHKI